MMKTWDCFMEHEADISLAEFHVNYLLSNVGVPRGSCDLISTLLKAFKSHWEPEGFGTFRTQRLLNSAQVCSSSRITGRAGSCSCTQAKENHLFPCFVNSASKEID